MLRRVSAVLGPLDGQLLPGRDVEAAGEVIEDGVIELDISKYHYIRLSHDNLMQLLEAIEFNPTTKEP